jgi:hypothetical protein
MRLTSAPAQLKLEGLTMLEKVLQLLAISCRHKNMSQPFATSISSVTHSAPVDWEPVMANGSGGHYVVCLDCGKKYGYDWATMRVLK